MLVTSVLDGRRLGNLSLLLHLVSVRLGGRTVGWLVSVVHPRKVDVDALLPAWLLAQLFLIL